MKPKDPKKSKKPEFKCKLCGHSWNPRIPGRKPAACPSCGSTYWQEGRQRAERSVQLQNAALLRKAKELVAKSQEPVHVPVLDDKTRRRALAEAGAVVVVGEELVNVGETNAGAWRLQPEYPDLEPMTLKEMLELESGDQVFRVSRDHGECLTEDGIYPGDIVVFRNVVPEPGDIVMAAGFNEKGEWVNTIKHFHPQGEWVELRPSNPEFETIKVRAKDIEILGVLNKHVRKNVRRGKPWKGKPN